MRKTGEKLILQRMRSSTRQKLVQLAKIEDRSPVAVLDRLLSDEMKRQKIANVDAVSAGACGSG